MNSIIPHRDGELSPEQESLAAQLTDSELEQVDQALMSYVTPQWRKVAYIVGSTMLSHSGLAPQLPDAFFARRVYRLIEIGKLECQGLPGYMGFCEVRISNAAVKKKAT